MNSFDSIRVTASLQQRQQQQKKKKKEKIEKKTME